MKTLTLFVIIVIFSCTALAQKGAVEPCNLKVSQSPEVRGLRLGQSAHDVERVYDSSSDNARRLSNNAKGHDVLGWTTEVIHNSPGNPSEKLKGVSFIHIQYLDGVIASIFIEYDKSITWPTSAEFASAVAGQLGLPSKAWDGALMPRMTCDGFFVEVLGQNKTSMLTIERANFKAEISRRAAQQERKSRAGFKP